MAKKNEVELSPIKLVGKEARMFFENQNREWPARTMALEPRRKLSVPLSDPKNGLVTRNLPRFGEDLFSF